MLSSGGRAERLIQVVSTQYEDSSGRTLDTNQYSVTDMSRETEHGRGVPGIFFKYDIEPMKLMIQERAGVCFFLPQQTHLWNG